MCAFALFICIKNWVYNTLVKQHLGCKQSIYKVDIGITIFVFGFSLRIRIDTDMDVGRILNSPSIFGKSEIRFSLDPARDMTEISEYD